MQRRNFLHGIAVASAGTTLQLASARAAGANNRVRVGLIGCGGRGHYVAERMRRVPDVEFVAACDVYERKRLRFRDWAGGSCTEHKDFREVLDRTDVDAVLVATPDHWHAIPTVLACKAGKDVYVEKPLAHNIREGRAMVTAAREHDRVVQTGTQQRSASHFQTMQEIIGSGRIGNVRYVRIWNFRNTSPGRKPQPSTQVPPCMGSTGISFSVPPPWCPTSATVIAVSAGTGIMQEESRPTLEPIVSTVCARQCRSTASHQKRSVRRAEDSKSSTEAKTQIWSK